MAAFRRFFTRRLKWEILLSTPAVATSFLQLENASYLLQEDGSSHIIL